MLRFYTPPLPSGVVASAVSAGLRDLDADDRALIDRRRAALTREIVEAEIRVDALAAVISNTVRAGREPAELEQRWAAEMDRLLDLRSDYSALCFLSGSIDEQTEGDLELL